MPDGAGVAGVADGESSPTPPLSSEFADVAVVAAEVRSGGTRRFGAALLDELREALIKFVILPSEEAVDAVVLWIAASHGQVAWQHAPRLAIVSPEKRCGKSRLMDIVSETARNPLITVNASPPAIYRSVEPKDPPTLLVDEADAIFGKKAADNNEDLRALLNAGHQRNRPALRYDVTSRRVVAHPTFSMAALAGIGDLPDTIMDRAVVVRMRRRASGERVSAYRTRRDQPTLNALRDRLLSWVDSYIDVLIRAEPAMPVEDRAADTWEPLVAIADLAGGDWPERGRAACVALVGAEAGTGEATSLGLRLLADLRDVFGDAEKMHTADILEKLHRVEDAPWGDFYGRPFSAHDLAKQLRQYGVAPVDVRVQQISKKGYKRDHLWDVWNRYISPSTQSPATTATTASPQVEAEEGSATVALHGRNSLFENWAEEPPLDQDWG